MIREMIDDYKKSLEFWEKAYADSGDQNTDNSNNWETLAPSEKFIYALSSFSKCQNVLDYGCGEGWGSIIMAKTGCKNITSVELSNSAIKKTIKNSIIYKVNKFVNAYVISENWINTEESDKYDGFFCSNVIDVIPEEIADNILKQAQRIVKPSKRIIISLNFYLDTKLNNNHEVKGKYLYREGILRMVNRTDQEWCDILSKFFKIEKIEHFAWPGETKETRRLFYLINSRHCFEG